ncbi:MAG TPA: flavodoxin family protein [Opitutaceae bacterium]|nr:flavodoxin family protein [Opitutaceae bacterium]
MKTIAIVYFSGTGHTAQMAEATHRGATTVEGTRALLLPIAGTDILEGRFRRAALLDQITEADAVILGTPTYMGGPAAQFKAFADATGSLWFEQRWKNKLAAGFTHSGMPSGDKLATLHYLALFAAQHGMLWLGNAQLPTGMLGRPGDLNRAGSYLGAMGHGPDEKVHPGDLATTASLGRRVAEFAQLVGAASRLASAA